MSTPTDKRRLLLEAADTLLRETGEAASLSVSQIAARAGVGKGTVYEYFDSKEALLAAALLYGNEKDCRNLLRELEALSGFEARMEKGLELLAQRAGSGSSLFLMLTGKLQPVLLERLQQERMRCRDGGQSLWRQAEKIIRDGMEEGVLAPDLSEGYIRQTMASLFLGYQCALLHARGDAAAIQAARENAGRMLLSALGKRT